MVRAARPTRRQEGAGATGPERMLGPSVPVQRLILFIPLIGLSQGGQERERGDNFWTPAMCQP